MPIVYLTLANPKNNQQLSNNLKQIL